MAKMWSSNEEFDFETAKDYASKLVLIGSAQKAGIFEALCEEKDNRKLIKRASNILKRGGMIAIEDMVRGRSPMAEMFAVNMLANTEDGNTYTEEQYREWLTDAGFQKIEIIDLAQKSNQLITAFWG